MCRPIRLCRLIPQLQPDRSVLADVAGAKPDHIGRPDAGTHVQRRSLFARFRPCVTRTKHAPCACVQARAPHMRTRLFAVPAFLIVELHTVMGHFILVYYCPNLRATEAVPRYSFLPRLVLIR